MGTERTVSATWTRLVIEALQDSGLDALALCSKSGINVDDLKNSYSRFPQDCLTRLWSEAEKFTGNSAIGLVMANRTSLRQLDAIVYNFISSTTLKESFKRIQKYQHILSESIDISIYKNGEGYIVDFVHHGDELPSVPQTIDASFASCTMIMNWVSEIVVKPIRIELSHKEQGNQSVYERAFNCPIVFDSGHNRLIVSAEDFERPIPTANEYIAKAHEESLRDLLHRAKSNALYLQVKDQMLKEMSSGNATIEKMARFFNISQRSFQRRLKEDGWTFRELLDNTRKELAKDYLCVDDISSNIISNKLGFAEPTAFIRAFKRWYGNTPSRYKKNYVSMSSYDAGVI